MYVYNQTVNIDETVHKQWLQWIENTYIPKMLATKKFCNARIFKVLIKEEMGGVTYSVQYFANSKTDLENFYKEDKLKLQQQMAAKFSNQFVTFETELQLTKEF